MATVIDASVMAAQLLRDEQHSEQARMIIGQLDNDDMIVPGIFWYEIRHVLLKARRTGRIDQADFENCLLELRDRFSLLEDGKRDEAKVIDLAQQHNLSVYDASYLETALRNRARLATYDDALAKAASKEKVENPAK